ncbi:MAG: hypothetical protein ACM3X7_02180 [Solirubrobacterales bacterium]
MDINYVSVGVSFLAGGAMGAIITQVATSVRNRIQPVGYKCESIPLFRKNLEGSTLITNVTISDEGVEYAFENLFVVNIEMINKGNKDFDKFTFGVTLDKEDKIINIEKKHFDKFHDINIIDEVSPKQPLNEVEIILKPFNRKDTYNIRMYVVIPEKNQQPSELQFSSPHSVKFTSMPSLGEATLSIGKLALEITADVSSSTAQKVLNNKTKK